MSPTSLIVSAALAFDRLGRTRRKGSDGKTDDSWFARREEENGTLGDSAPPADGVGLDIPEKDCISI